MPGRTELNGGWAGLAGQCTGHTGRSIPRAARRNVSPPACRRYARCRFELVVAVARSTARSRSWRGLAEQCRTPRASEQRIHGGAICIVEPRVCLPQGTEAARLIGNWLLHPE